MFSVLQLVCFRVRQKRRHKQLLQNFLVGGGESLSLLNGNVRNKTGKERRKNTHLETSYVLKIPLPPSSLRSSIVL